MPELDSEIRIKLTPPQSERASLADFSNVCGALKACLSHVARCVGQENTSFGISDLEIGSAVVAVVPNENGAAVTQAFSETIENLQTGRVLDVRLDYLAICSFDRFSSTIRHEDVDLSINGIRLTSDYVNNVAKLMEPQHSASGSVSGRLEAVSVHGKNKFTLYPPVPNEHVVCQFDDERLSEVLAAVDHQVTVHGTMYYARTKTFPVRVDVSSFEIVPDNAQLSSLLDARGALSSLSGQSSVDIQRSLRDEWN